MACGRLEPWDGVWHQLLTARGVRTTVQSGGPRFVPPRQSVAKWTKCGRRVASLLPFPAVRQHLPGPGASARLPGVAEVAVAMVNWTKHLIGACYSMYGPWFSSTLTGSAQLLPACWYDDGASTHLCRTHHPSSPCLVLAPSVWNCDGVCHVPHVAQWHARGSRSTVRTGTAVAASPTLSAAA